MAAKSKNANTSNAKPSTSTPSETTATKGSPTASGDTPGESRRAAPSKSKPSRAKKGTAQTKKTPKAGVLLSGTSHLYPESTALLKGPASIAGEIAGYLGYLSVQDFYDWLWKDENLAILRPYVDERKNNYGVPIPEGEAPPKHINFANQTILKVFEDQYHSWSQWDHLPIPPHDQNPYRRERSVCIAMRQLLRANPETFVGDHGGRLVHHFNLEDWWRAYAVLTFVQTAKNDALQTERVRTTNRPANRIEYRAANQSGGESSAEEPADDQAIGTSKVVRTRPVDPANLQDWPKDRLHDVLGSYDDLNGFLAQSSDRQMGVIEKKLAAKRAPLRVDVQKSKYPAITKKQRYDKMLAIGSADQLTIQWPVVDDRDTLIKTTATLEKEAETYRRRLEETGTSIGEEATEIDKAFEQHWNIQDRLNVYRAEMPSYDEACSKLNLDPKQPVIIGFIGTEHDPVENHTLRPWQVQGIAWIVEMMKSSLAGCLLADEMGLGKTIQCISALAFLAIEEGASMTVAHAVEDLVVESAEPNEKDALEASSSTGSTNVRAMPMPGPSTLPFSPSASTAINQPGPNPASFQTPQVPACQNKPENPGLASPVRSPLSPSQPTISPLSPPQNPEDLDPLPRSPSSLNGDTFQTLYDANIQQYSNEPSVPQCQTDGTSSPPPPPGPPNQPSRPTNALSRIMQQAATVGADQHKARRRREDLFKKRAQAHQSGIALAESLVPLVAEIKKRRFLPTLIVAPSNAMQVWKDEFATHFKAFNVQLFYGSRARALKEDMNRVLDDTETLLKYIAELPDTPEAGKTIILTSYSTFALRTLYTKEAREYSSKKYAYKTTPSQGHEDDDLNDESHTTSMSQAELDKFASVIGPGCFGTIVYDECQVIKDVRTLAHKALLELQAPRRILLTATYMMNRPLDLTGPLWQIYQTEDGEYAEFPGDSESDAEGGDLDTDRDGTPAKKRRGKGQSRTPIRKGKGKEKVSVTENQTLGDIASDSSQAAGDESLEDSVRDSHEKVRRRYTRWLKKIQADPDRIAHIDRYLWLLNAKQFRTMMSLTGGQGHSTVDPSLVAAIAPPILSLVVGRRTMASPYKDINTGQQRRTGDTIPKASWYTWELQWNGNDARTFANIYTQLSPYLTAGVDEEGKPRRNPAYFRRLSLITGNLKNDRIIVAAHDSVAVVEASIETYQDLGVAHYFSLTRDNERLAVPLDRLFHIDWLTEYSPKYKALVLILRRVVLDEKRSLLVFVDWPLHGWQLEMLLWLLSFDALVIRAIHTVEQRNEAVREFNKKREGRPVVLITSLRTSATALNLQTGGNDIVFLDYPGNLNLMFQAAGRMIRLNQMLPVQVYVLTVDHSFDTVIQGKAHSKAVGVVAAAGDYDGRSSESLNEGQEGSTTPGASTPQWNRQALNASYGRALQIITGSRSNRVPWDDPEITHNLIYKDGLEGEIDFRKQQRLPVDKFFDPGSKQCNASLRQTLQKKALNKDFNNSFKSQNPDFDLLDNIEQGDLLSDFLKDHIAPDEDDDLHLRDEPDIRSRPDGEYHPPVPTPPLSSPNKTDPAAPATDPETNGKSDNGRKRKRLDGGDAPLSATGSDDGLRRSARQKTAK